MKNFFGILLWAIIIPLVAILLVTLIHKDPGLVFITGDYLYFGEKTFRFTIVGMLVFISAIFVLTYIVIRLAVQFLALPRTIHRRYIQRRERKAEDDYSKAQLFLRENKPRPAEGLFLRAADYSAHPSQCLIGAARAAHLQNSPERRDKYLNEIDHPRDKQNYILAQIERGEFLLEIGEDEKAQRVLEQFVAEHHNHNAIILLAKTYQKRGLFQKLYEFMPELQRATLKLPNIAEQEAIYLDLLEFAAKEGNAQEVKNVWNNIPKELRQHHNLIIKYADRLMICNDSDAAETILRNAIRKDPSDTLMLAYGHLYRGNLTLLLRQAKRFANENSDNAYAQFALGKLQLRSKDLKSAEESTKKALKIDPTLAVAYKLYGEIKLEQNDEHAALKAFQQVNELLLPDGPKDVIKTEGELLIDNTTRLADKAATETADGEYSEK